MTLPRPAARDRQGAINAGWIGRTCVGSPTTEKVTSAPDRIWLLRTAISQHIITVSER
jgi:hypothetical protein